MGRRGRLGAVAAAAALVAGVAVTSVRAHEARAPTGGPLSARPSLAVIRESPEFVLLDAVGRTLRLSALRGRVVLLAFVYTRCPTACPLVSQGMAVLQQRLIAAGHLPGRAVLLSVTVDAERDDGPTLVRYAGALRAHADGWWFLHEKPERLRPALAAFDEWTRREPDGGIDHPARLHLIDPRGRVREIYSLALFDERQAFLDIEALLRE